MSSQISLILLLCVFSTAINAFQWQDGYDRSGGKNNARRGPQNGNRRTGSSGGGSIVFPDAPRLTLGDEIRRVMIQKSDNVSEIIAALKVEMPDDDPASLRTARQYAAPATCEPEFRTVPVEAENNIDQYFIPFCVRVKRCGGCCPSGFECIPKKTSTTSVRGAKVRRSRRSEDGLKGEYVTMQVEQHDECSCSCKIRAENCNPSIHEYSASDCKCNCKNLDELSRCASSTLQKVWDGDECMCKCKTVLHCSSGQVFSHETCSCVSG